MGGVPLTTYKSQLGWSPKYAVLVGGWTNPFEKNARQIGSFPPFLGVKNPQVGGTWRIIPFSK